jgi:cytidylate kinase
VPQPKRIICVSHLTGAEGETVARRVAERLGLRYVDDEIIETAAEWTDLDPSVVGDVERRRSLLARIGESIRGTSLPSRPDAAVQRRSGAALRDVPSSDDLRALIRDVIREAAVEGNTVIASHAASLALADREDVLRVLITASPKTRADRIMDARSVDSRRAESILADEDAARADYLRRFHGVERELPTHYDLVVNTDALSAERGAELIVLAAEGSGVKPS